MQPNEQFFVAANDTFVVWRWRKPVAFTYLVAPRNSAFLLLIDQSGEIQQIDVPAPAGHIEIARQLLTGDVSKALADLLSTKQVTSTPSQNLPIWVSIPMIKQMTSTPAELEINTAPETQETFVLEF